MPHFDDQILNNNWVYNGYDIKRNEILEFHNYVQNEEINKLKFNMFSFTDIFHPPVETSETINKYFYELNTFRNGEIFGFDFITYELANAVVMKNFLL